jgi:hypothetical protein
MGKKSIDLTGMKFGDLTVLGRGGHRMRGETMGELLWYCRCACGKETRPTGYDLRAGKTKSCGHDFRKKLLESHTTHGQSGTRLYRIWKGMHQRCQDKSNPHYGAKGILVCDEWKTFEPFFKWAKKFCYADHLTIERLENNLGYSPHNCTWIPRGHQAYNRGVSKRAPDGRLWRHIARENGITNSAYSTRIDDGWSPEDAANRPMFQKINGVAPEVVLEIIRLDRAGRRNIDIARAVSVRPETVHKIRKRERARPDLR